MVRTTHLDLTTARGTPLPTTLLRHDDGSNTIALLFPGLGYRATMPLLHYTQRALTWRGADVLRLDLAYDLDPAFPTDDAVQRRRWIRDDALLAFAAASRLGNHRNVVLVGKSLGTLALADILDREDLLPAAGCVWLTPLLHDPALREALGRPRPPSLIAIGTGDPLYDGTLLDDLAARGRHDAVVVPGADHSLEVPGDAAGTVDALRTYLSALESFLARIAKHP
jgi:dienelactone hydrolase